MIFIDFDQVYICDQAFLSSICLRKDAFAVDRGGHVGQNYE